MKIRYITNGILNTNCYVIIDEKSGECAAVDCADFDGKYRDFFEKLGIKELKYILLTHGHFDHISGVNTLKEQFGGKVCIHTDDAACLSDEKLSVNYIANTGPLNKVVPDIILDDGDTLMLGENKIKVMHTPGHTKGSVCYITENSIFSGDTLFRLSMGRTDMPGGSTRQLFKSLEKLGQLDGDYDIYPGHDKLTTLEFEKKYNGYLRAK